MKGKHDIHSCWCSQIRSFPLRAPSACQGILPRSRCRFGPAGRTWQAPQTLSRAGSSALMRKDMATFASQGCTSRAKLASGWALAGSETLGLVHGLGGRACRDLAYGLSSCFLCLFTQTLGAFRGLSLWFLFCHFSPGPAHWLYCL